jgi:FAD/FMN-containing dehydrogenase
MTTSTNAPATSDRAIHETNAGPSADGDRSGNARSPQGGSGHWASHRLRERLRPRDATRPDDFEELANRMSHQILLPGEEGYDAARAPWAVNADLRPAAVAQPRDAAQVQLIVRAAAGLGLRIAPQGTGHHAHAMPRSLDDVVLLRTNMMNRVSIDPDRRIARAESGAVWLDVVEPAGRHGLAALHGSSPDVGVAGYSLGGGIGWYARKLGMATNSLTAVELVTASGELVRADAEHEPELFWALRGGGGNFGVVTALEFALFPITTAYAGMMVWDCRHAERVLRRYAEWAPEAADEVTTSLRLLQVPPIPEMPEFVRGRQVVAIDGAVLADDETAERILAPLRELGPEIDFFGRKPAPELVRLHMDPEGPTPTISESAMLGWLAPSGVDALLGVAGPDSGSSLLVAAELRQLGGALGRAHPGAGALPRLEGSFALLALGMPNPMADEERTRADARRVVTAMAPYANGRSYLNFVEKHGNAGTGYDPRTWDRLRAVRRQYDPAGLFVANHQIPLS